MTALAHLTAAKFRLFATPDAYAIRRESVPHLLSLGVTTVRSEPQSGAGTPPTSTGLDPPE